VRFGLICFREKQLEGKTVRRWLRMTASNRAVVLQLFDDINTHDLATVRKLFSDSVYHSPLTGELRGEALKRFFTSLIEAFPDLNRTVEDQFTDEDHVVSRWRCTGTHQGIFMGIAATSKRVTFTGISIHRIADGKIVEEWQEWDLFGLMQQLGVPPLRVREPRRLNSLRQNHHRLPFDPRNKF
jgi:steroid delta-isomerase-like uncharacterized protein